MRLALLASIAIVGLTTVAHADQPSGQLTRIKYAEQQVRAILTDPDSAEFKGEYVGDNGGVCGQVNAKNQMGGYDGYTPFIYGKVGDSTLDTAMILGHTGDDGQWDAAENTDCVVHVKPLVELPK